MKISSYINWESRVFLVACPGGHLTVVILAPAQPWSATAVPAFPWKATAASADFTRLVAAGSQNYFSTLPQDLAYLCACATAGNPTLSSSCLNQIGRAHV